MEGIKCCSRYILFIKSHDELTSVTLRNKANKKRMLDLGDAKHNYSEKNSYFLFFKTFLWQLYFFSDSLNLKDSFM